MWLLWVLVVTTGSMVAQAADVILINNTDLEIARIEIDSKRYEELRSYDKLLVDVTPARHNMRIIFRGGADVDFPKFDFSNAHEVFFERHENKIEARVQ